MWVKKTKEELRIDKWKDRYSLKEIILISTIITIIASVFKRIGVYGRNLGLPMKWDDIANQIPGIFLTFCIAIFLFQVFLYRGRFITNNTENNSCICLYCNKPHKRNSEMKCVCGGQLELLKDMKWIRED